MARSLPAVAGTTKWTRFGEVAHLTGLGLEFLDICQAENVIRRRGLRDRREWSGPRPLDMTQIS